jgi:murein DD-endopeptidase MepM/ murein hydrolase activator NlpD
LQSQALVPAGQTMFSISFNFIKIFSINSVRADGTLIPHLRKALFVMGNFMRALHLLTTLFFLVPNLLLAQLDSNRIFAKSKGTFDYPIKKVTRFENFNHRKSICDGDINSKRLVFFSDSSYPVNAIFDGIVGKVAIIEGTYLVIINFGNYSIAYFGLTKPAVSEGNFVRKGQILSYLTKNLDDDFAVEIYLYNQTKEIDPFPWFK